MGGESAAQVTLTLTLWFKDSWRLEGKGPWASHPDSRSGSRPIRYGSERRLGVQIWCGVLGLSLRSLSLPACRAGGLVVSYERRCEGHTQGVISTVLSIWSTLRACKMLARMLQLAVALWGEPVLRPSHSALGGHQPAERSLSSAAEAGPRRPPTRSSWSAPEPACTLSPQSSSLP